MTDIYDVIGAISWIQPPWVDGGESYRAAKAVASAYGERIDAGDVSGHGLHALWMLEAALEWAVHDEDDCDEDEPVVYKPAYKPAEECPYCAVERAEGEVGR